MNDKQEYNPETVDAILDVMRRELEAEEDRHNFILSKTNIILTISSILIAAISLPIKDFRSLLPKPVFLVIAAGLLCLFCSVLISLFVILKARFERIDFGCLLNELAKDSTEVKTRLIATYDKTINRHAKILDGKVKIQNCCTLLTIAGTILILCSLIIGFVYNIKIIAF